MLTHFLRVEFTNFAQRYTVLQKAIFMRKTTKNSNNSRGPKMSEAHYVRLDRNAFNRGFEDIITLKPLRDAVSGVIHKTEPGKKSSSVMSTISVQRGSNEQRQPSRKK